MTEQTQSSQTSQAERETPSVAVRSGDLLVRLAESEDEIRAAQLLRYRIFYDEMTATPTPEVARAKRDFDRFDEAADHLLVVDTSQTEVERAVVGTYRLIRRDASKHCGGFYTKGEFDIARLDAYPGEILELGRSCVDAGYRSGRVINLLWRGIAHYLKEYDVQLMFGCGSLPGTDPEALRLTLSYLHHYHLAPRHVRPRARPERYVEMNMLPKDAIDPKQAMAEIPPLIKGYLRLGGFVGNGAVIDAEFGCTDVCIVVKADLMTAKYARYYGCEVQSLNAA